MDAGGRPCTVCGHPERRAIDEALRAGEKPPEVPGLSARCVARHAASAHHERPAAPRPVAAPRPAAKVPRPDDFVADAGAPSRLGDQGPAPERDELEQLPGVPPTKEGRIGHVMGLIAADLWSAESGAELAREWRLSEGTLAHYASEAHRRVKSSIDTVLLGRIAATSAYRALTAGVALAEAGDSRALSGVAGLLRSCRDLLPKGPADTGAGDPPVFRVELSEPERPAAAQPEPVAAAPESAPRLKAV